MASKASKLMQGVNKTGKGLFAGMTPIGEESSSEKFEKLKPETEEKKVPKEPAITKPKEKEPEPIKPVVEKVAKEEKIVKEDKPVKPETPKETTEIKVEKTEKSEKASRYEKDKFLLLDVRGYRDYVEHMAKAANMSATKYIRSLIEADMQKNMDIYEAHKALEEKFKGRI